MKKYQALLVSIVLLYSCSGGKNDNANYQTNEIVKEKQTASTVSKLQDLKDAEYKFKSYDYKSFYTVTEIETAIGQMQNYAQKIDAIMASENPTKEEKSLADKCRFNLIADQKKYYPVMRKAYAEIMKKKLWQEDIDVVFGGKTITLIGGYFAANANKQSTQEQLVEILTKLRFAQVNYKWMKYADEFTYYKLESQPDGSLIY